MVVVTSPLIIAVAYSSPSPAMSRSHRRRQHRWSSPYPIYTLQIRVGYTAVV